MSRLAPIDEVDLPPQPRRAPTKVLRSRRRRPLHPEQIAGLLRDQAARASVGALAAAPHGWLVIVYLDDQIGPNGFPKRVVRELLPGTTLEDARHVLDTETRILGRRDAWIVAKSRADQKTVKP